MRLGYIFLNNVNGVNSFREVPALTIVKGVPATIYVRVVDLDEVWDGRPLRYIPASGATMVADYLHVDSGKQVLGRVASTPFAEDTSIWSIPVLATDAVAQNGLQLRLTIGGVEYTLIASSMLVTQGTGSGKCFA